LELFGEDHNIRPGWVTVGTHLTSSNFNPQVGFSRLPYLVTPDSHSAHTLTHRNKRKESITSFGVRLMRSQVLYRAAQDKNTHTHTHTHTQTHCYSPC